MSEIPPHTTEDMVRDAEALDGKASAEAERTLRFYEGRVVKAAGMLEGQALAFRYGAIPAVAITTLVILATLTDRSAPAVILTALFAVMTAMVLSAILGGFAAIVRLNATQAELLDRIAASLEAPRPAEAVGPSAAELKAEHLAEIRHSIRSGHWDEAGALVQAFRDTHPDDPEAPRLVDELTEARAAAGRDRLVKIEAAREANDPERVIELHDEVKPLLDADALRALDVNLAKWFMMMIHRRLRTGTVKADVAILAGRVASSFDGTPEGASLRASLPTLRRAAGLCARCAQPYTGIADACPACLSGATAPNADASTPLTETIEPEPDESV